jgi:hypothetical protein
MQESPLSDAEAKMISSTATSDFTPALPRSLIVLGAAQSFPGIWPVVLRVLTGQALEALEAQEAYLLVQEVQKGAHPQEVQEAEAQEAQEVVLVALVVDLEGLVVDLAGPAEGLVDRVVGLVDLVEVLPDLHLHHRHHRHLIHVTYLFLPFQIQSYRLSCRQRYLPQISHIIEEPIGIQRMFEPGMVSLHPKTSIIAAMRPLHMTVVIPCWHRWTGFLPLE